MKKQHKPETTRHLIRRYIFLVIGATLAATAIELFLVENTIIDGGIIGISLLLNHLTNINFGILVFVINLPFLYFGYKYIGKSFSFASLFGIIILAVIEPSLQPFPAITNEPLLATVFGGLILGAGVGIVIRVGGALDGTEILSILLTKKIPFSVGEMVMFFNIFIFGWAGFVLGWEQAMYSILTYYIASKTIDAITQGFNDTKAAIIVSDQYEEIADTINQRLGRTVTRLHGQGGFFGEEKDIIYVVIIRLEISKLKDIIYEIDPNAFTTIMDAQEARGGKFKSAIH
ncbi:YitT family protein [Pseudogracilibacillus sp. SE30717A]|uniref:YitT family protein n=1 Tax=Pseudogracilibacillus sp. SE30717A TaxID=3098293 RepID=UPI00300E4024